MEKCQKKVHEFLNLELINYRFWKSPLNRKVFVDFKI